MAVSDTIAAIATAAGPGGIGVIRVSGALAPGIAQTLLGRAPRPRHAHHCRFRTSHGELIDEGLLLYFPAPRSFTGEDVVELQAHGSPVALQRLLRRTLELGARLARPGEFSERAYLNDKLDLAQAEAIADLIAAGSESAARAAMRTLSGEFSQRVQRLSQQLIELRVYVEAAIDFPEEEIDFLRTDEVRARFAGIELTLHELLAAARRGQRLRDGLQVVIVGAPNVGKSSLLNALAGEERAIVTPVAGTTRDLLREHLVVEGLPITLIDTAGLRATTDLVEREGITRAERAAGQADLLLWVRDAGAAGVDDDALRQGIPRSVPQLIVYNKIDLIAAEPALRRIEGGLEVRVSARSGAGLDLLRQALLQMAGLGEGSEGDFSARARHVSALERTQDELAAARTLALTHAQGELAAEHLRLAHEALGEILGRFHSDQLLGAIFSSFCIGK